MSATVSGSQKSNLGWKVTAVVFIILTLGASALAYYYYGQNQTKISNAANATNYYSQWQADETKISSLNQQISSDQSQIQSLNNQITQLQNSGYHPICAPNCDTTISNLQSQITQLNAQVAADQTQIISLQAQIASDQEILGLSKQIVLVDSTTYNWVACGGTSQPSCNGVDTIISPSYSYPSSTKFYAGYLAITWSSTASLNLHVQTPGFIPVQTSSSATTALISVSPTAPVSGLPITILWQVGEPPCTVGIITGNHACPSGTITYSITYYY